MMARCSITQSGDSYAIKTPFSRQFVDELKKSVPMANRKFDGESKCWIVTPLFAEMAAQIIQEYFGEKPEIPKLKPVELSQKYSFQLDYVGIPKERIGETEKTALGLSKGDWRIVFTEAILKNWFEKLQTSKDETLFSLLLVTESATDQEIKSGYRRLARQWHPDVCHEENASEMFQRIDSAYKILSDPLKKKKYLAGLYFERSQNGQSDYYKRSRWNDSFIPPLRCGNLTVTGSITVGRLRVSEILSWSDIENDQGQVMVSSWDRDLNAVRMEWV